MSHRPALPPHLADEEELKDEAKQASFSKIGPQGPSKYGAGGRRLFKAKNRSDRTK